MLKRTKARDKDKDKDKRKGGKTSEILKKLGTYYRTKSSTMHKRFQKNPQEWAEFHEAMEESKKKWSLNPLRRIGDTLLKVRKGRVVADLGCGPAKLADRCTGTTTCCRSTMWPSTTR